MSTGVKKSRINTKRIKKYLIENNITQNELAERMNKMRSTPKEITPPISLFVNGFENFTIDRFILLVQTTGLPPNELLPWQEWVSEAKNREGGKK